MTIFVCDQDAVMPDGCICCGGWLHVEQRGGFPGPGGRYCSEDCAADQAEYIEKARRDHHLGNRDLLCDCSTCTAAGHPTADELAEYAAYASGPGAP